MQDASKEFSIFIAPQNEIYHKPHRETSISKHRVVPVINRLFSVSSTSFTIHQRKANLYKAVSGVSFQETDVENDKNTLKHNDALLYGRRCSYAPAATVKTAASDKDDRSGQAENVKSSGARRSRSLTSMGSGLTVFTDHSKNPPEIVHPFTPVILRKENSGRRGRYSRIKERGRSKSQSRHKTVQINYENEGNKTEEEIPIRPTRRTRSASRSRISFSIFKNDTEKSFKNDKYDLYSIDDKDIKKSKPPHTPRFPRSKFYTTDIEIHPQNDELPEKPELKTEQSSSFSRKKEEPEGGYFSLERDEIEDLIDFDQYERNNFSESIYVVQGISPTSTLPQKVEEVYKIEDIYSEVPICKQNTDNGFYDDDEEIYEEIFTEKEKKATEVNSNTILMTSGEEKSHEVSETKLVSVEKCGLKNSNNFEAPQKCDDVLKSSDLPKSSSSTVVYISDSRKPNKEIISIPNNCGELLSPKLILPLVSASQGTNIFNSSNDIRETKKLSWLYDIGKSTDSTFKFAQNYSKDLTSSNLLTKATMHFPKVEALNKSVFSDFESLSNLSGMKLSSLETEYDFKDLDFDLFTPKNAAYNPYPIIKKDITPTNCSSEFLEIKTSLIEEKVTNVSNHIFPKTFQGFLKDSIFNPPDSDANLETVESLVIIDKDQNIACISDSTSEASSSDSEEDYAKPIDLVKSPWLQAESEFEYVAYKELRPITNGDKLNGTHEKTNYRKDIVNDRSDRSNNINNLLNETTSNCNEETDNTTSPLDNVIRHRLRDSYGVQLESRRQYENIHNVKMNLKSIQDKIDKWESSNLQKKRNNIYGKSDNNSKFESKIPLSIRRNVSNTDDKTKQFQKQTQAKCIPNNFKISESNKEFKQNINNRLSIEKISKELCVVNKDELLSDYRRNQKTVFSKTHTSIIDSNVNNVIQQEKFRRKLSTDDKKVEKDHPIANFSRERKSRLISVPNLFGNNLNLQERRSKFSSSNLLSKDSLEIPKRPFRSRRRTTDIFPSIKIS